LQGLVKYWICAGAEAERARMDARRSFLILEVVVELVY
jgi:hypothetical protein